MNSAGNKILTFISLAAFLGAAYLGYTKVYPMYFAPCGKPVTYRVAGFDSRFGISKSDFERALTQAEVVWEKPSGHNLFESSPNGSVAVSLVYDYRQEAMDRLKALGINIDTSKKTYDSLNAQYQSQLSAYKLAKSQIDALVSQYNKLKAQYDADVKAYQSSRRPTQSQYSQIKFEETELNNLADQINAKQAALKPLVDDINALVNLLNQLAGELNLNVTEYNQVGTSTGSEFQEGVYTQDATSRQINIYEFTNHDELVRVLAHELGHALGLEHVADPNAIMYRLNQSKNGQATPADLSELNRACKF